MKSRKTTGIQTGLRIRMLSGICALILSGLCVPGRIGQAQAEEELKIVREQAETEGAAEDSEQTAIAAKMNQEQEIRKILHQMTLEEKVAQLFVVLPESLVGIDTVTAAGEATRTAIQEIPIGGLIYMKPNLLDEEQVKTMIAHVQSYSMERIGLPLLISVDEEGGTVARISGTGRFDVPYIGTMEELGSRGSRDEAYATGKVIGSYLADLGFNLDFAPVADVLSNPENQVVRSRSFGSDPSVVADMTCSFLEGLEEQGVYGTMKHFPGHGATAGDTHAGYAGTDKSLEQLQKCELIPFQEGIRNGVQFVMVGHISVPDLTGDGTPASLSYTVITELLRKQMGYDGLVITDALNMGAIAQNYSSAEAAVRTLKAGTDLVLMPGDLRSAFAGVLSAVQSGELSEERIDESLRRILRVKLTWMKNSEIR